MIRLEIFSGDPPCPGCVAIIQLAKQVAARYDGELELAIYEGAEGLEKFEAYKYDGELELAIYEGAEGLEKFEAYKLFCVPAAVVNETIRIEGMCPSKATLNNALREGGLCTPAPVTRNGMNTPSVMRQRWSLVN